MRSGAALHDLCCRPNLLHTRIFAFSGHRTACLARPSLPPPSRHPPAVSLARFTRSLCLLLHLDASTYFRSHRDQWFRLVGRPHQFDVASVTPSQSASQVIDHDRSNVPLGQRYTSHFEDVEEQEGVPSDTDSEEDYRRAFIEPRMRMPAPHQLGVAAETQDSFIPQGQSGKQAANGFVPPPPPQKDDETSHVHMPPVPAAPVFDVNQARGYDQGYNGDQGYTPGNNQNWDRQQVASAAYSPPRYSMSRRSGDSDSGYGHGHQRKSSNSLIGKVSRLFKTDIRNGAAPDREESGWNTRITANVQHENVRRGNASLRRTEPDSSDEELDTREVFRNVNQQRPGWEQRGNDSDVGGKNKLTTRILPGPKSNRVHEAEQADIDRIRASVVGGGIGSTAPVKQNLASGADSIRSNTTATKKKKKKRPVAGSEVGTAPTRPAGTYSVAGDLSSLHANTGNPGNPGNTGGDNASLRPGISRSSTMRSTSSKKKSRNSVANTGLVGGNIFNPNAGKYGAESWIKKPASQMTAYEAVAMAGVVPKSAAPKDKPATTTTNASAANPAASLSPAPTGTSSRPASVLSSAGKNPPLKSALKTPTVSRSNSTASARPTSTSTSKKAAAGPGAAAGLTAKSGLRNDITQSIRAEPLPQPKLEPVPKAPAPVASMPEIVETQRAPISQAPAPVPQKPAPSQPAEGVTTAQPTETVSTPTVEAKKVAPAPQSALSIEEDLGFDGTGRLDLPVDRRESPSVEKDPTATSVQQNKAQMPKLDMPSSEPFSISFDGVSKAGGARRGSAMTTESAAEEGVVTPGIEQTYKAFMQQHSQSPSIQRSGEATPIGTQAQPAGVTRLVDRKVKLEPSRVYGVGAPEVSDTSSDEGSAVQAANEEETQAEGGAQKAARVQASSALVDADHKPDPALQSLSSANAAKSMPATATSATSPAKALVANKAPSETDSMISRRKSVRMAPDVKLPPDTPTEGDFATPRGHEYGGQDPIAARGSQLSKRIAPPPAAPAKPTKEPGPIDLGANRQPTGWTSRIRDTVDSSDEEDVDDDGYSKARKAFGSATRGWGEAMGTAKPKTKTNKAGDAASVKSKVSTTSKKGAAPKRASQVSGTGATVAAPQPSIGYVPTAPGSMSSTLHIAKAPGSSVGAGAGAEVPSASMYSVTAPGSVVNGGGAAAAASSTPTAAAPVSSLPSAGSPQSQTPAPLTASNLNALDGNKNRPEMPPVPVAPPAQGESTMNVPTAPPPAISGKGSSSGGKGFFRRFKRNK